jgi:hypothetical protein
MKKWTIVLAIFAIIVFFPLSIRMIDPLFTRPFDARFGFPVLLAFPDHVEVRRVSSLSEVSPRPRSVTYSFAVPEGRERWVQKQLQNAPPPRAGSAWKLEVKQIGNDTQRIDLEAFHDGFDGLIYDAHPDEIVPTASRSAGPSGAFVYLLIDAGLSCALVLLVHFVQRSLVCWRKDT